MDYTGPERRRTISEATIDLLRDERARLAGDHYEDGSNKGCDGCDRLAVIVAEIATLSSTERRRIADVTRTSTADTIADAERRAAAARGDR